MTMNVAVSGVKAATADLNVTAHNIANVNTTGFKNSRAEFADVIGGRGSDGLLGVQTQTVNQLFKQGGINSTGYDGSNGQLDLAINGNGFFTVTDTSSLSPYYTRAGSFRMDATTRNIVNNLGQNLLDSAGAPITVPPSPVTITGFNSITGAINFSDSTSIQVGLVNFDNVQGLKAVGDTNWIWTTAASPAPPAIGAAGANGTGSIRGGALEASNVDLTDQLVNMIVAQRNFQANAKTITTENTLSETIINIR
ncbi:MAG: flagellar hook basal-body protein [Synechococcaceae cyanobacterium SM1_2_3]|nr:flagellar hook basal-body protein [Synechococcaceae cyanobacterium SM1_2_3]